ncbi:hypothetical protein D9758_003329 [Tetrapyrgos nigripes]|uniref:Protein transport protein sec16 n=1 Tax=Tetrapyrgos nigripes TaxID=182062 RepID=A0A8H5LQF9_9AGAR|nr:hypothetical protein D9758_003329 [Tetrapyrgos nigripes]
MASLEAAASLFGSEDADADPFASLGSDVPSTETSLIRLLKTYSPIHKTTQHTIFRPLLPTAFLRKGSRKNSTATATQAVSYDNAYNSDWQHYSQPVVNGSTLSNNHASTYDPYAPSQYAPAEIQQGSYAPSYTSAAAQPSNYSPYAPPAAVPTAQATYTPPQPSYAPQVQPTQYSAPPQSAYAPQSQQAQYGTPAYSIAAQTNSSVPPPPPKAPLNRLKVSNAYDPPFPTTTSRRRPTPSSSVYSTYNAPTTSPLPPPPLRPPSNASYTSESHPPPPPRPPSNASYSSHHAAPRPPSSASYSQSPPPRPSSNASYFSLNRPPSRPPSGSPYSPLQPGPGTSSTTSLHYSPSTTYEPTGSIISPPPARSSPLAATGQNESVYESAAHTLNSVNTTDEYPYDPEGDATIVDHREDASSGPEPWTSDSALNNREPGQPEHSPEHSVHSPSENESVGFTSTNRTSPDLMSNPDHRTSPMQRGTHDNGPHDSSSPTSVKSHEQPSEASGPHLPESAPSILPSDPYKPTVNTQPWGHASSVSADPYVPQMQRGTHDKGLHDSSFPTSGKSYGQPSEASGPHFLESTPSILPSDPYKPTVNTQPWGLASSVSSDPYAPQTSPEQMSPPSSATSYGNPYISQNHSTRPPPPRSMSINSVSSTKSEDPYAPSLHTQVPSNANDHGPYGTFSPVSNDVYTTNGPLSGLGQDIYMKAAPTHTPYAPSPSLLGTNDPLGRYSARIPVFNFGFGGKVVTCFHGADKLNTGFDVALASKNSTGIQIQVLNKIIPESALTVSVASFPGPLFSDPGTPTTGLVRPGVSAQTKTKKARVLKYLEERASEISQGLNYLHAGSTEHRQAEGKLVLVKLLKVMVENDGKITGSPQIESAVRASLVPRLDTSLSESESSSLTVPGFTPADLQGSSFAAGLTDPADAPTTTYSIRPSALEKIQDFLLRGQRRQAYHYALDQKLWAHAMVIASGIDKEAWQEAVNEFLKTELGSVRSQSSKVTSSGKEGLRIAYSLFSGQGVAAVQQLIPQNLLSDHGSRALLPSTPMTPSFASASSTKIPAESLSQWAETVAMILSGTMSSENSNAITALGDHLAANNWIEAAHACYLLAPQTSPVGGFAHQTARIALLGSRNPHTIHNFASDPDPIILSEILEFALSLTPAPKGQEPFSGLPHLQPYRFIRAVHLAELGDINLASRYCEAITASLTRPTPYTSNALLEQIRGLADRIVGVTHVDKSGSWMGNKLGKPSLDSIGGWLEGRFTKFVTGDLDSPGMKDENAQAEDRGFVGTFSQYSSISSTTTSTSPSPQSSVTNLNIYAPPPPHSGTSMPNRSALGVALPSDRASSAMDYSRPKASLHPRVASASAATTTFAQSQSFGQAASHYSPYSPMGNGSSELLTPRPALESTEEEGQEVTWWGSSSAVTPTATSFVRLNEASTPVSTDGFISLMDDSNFTVASSSRTSHTSRRNDLQDDMDEDLGFGNAKPRSKAADEDRANNDAKPEAATPAKAPVRPDAKPTDNPAGSGSWLSRLWKRDSTPAPVKANLGEEVSFYYDKDLKRWVNKQAGDDGPAKPTATPPPPRAQTASPALSGPRPPSAGLRLQVPDLLLLDLHLRQI